MTVTTEKERQEFQQEVAAWFVENNPGDPGFLLPETFMEVGNKKPSFEMNRKRAKILGQQ